MKDKFGALWFVWIGFFILLSLFGFLGVFWVCGTFFWVKLSFFKYKAGQSHIIDVAVASSQSWRSHHLVLTWRRAERDISPPLQQDVNIFSFCDICRTKGAF